jgi:hypothetical protein
VEWRTLATLEPQVESCIALRLLDLIQALSEELGPEPDQFEINGVRKDEQR